MGSPSQEEFKFVICRTGSWLGGPVVKNLPANVGDMGSIPGLGQFHMLGDNSAGVPQIL